MANQWYYMNGDEKHGPYSDAQLKELARGGKLQKDDRIWKEGMSQWRTAGSVKGLFPQANPTTPPPLPVKPTVDESTEEREGNQDASASFGGSAKLAGQLATKQAVHTKIQQVHLPALYLSIGQQVFDTDFHAETHESLFDEIKRLNQKISELEVAGVSSPKAKTIADKAKALGNQTVIAGKVKTSQFQRRQKLIALGKASYERGEVPKTCSKEQHEIQRHLDRLIELQSEIVVLKTEASAAGKSLMASTAVVASFAFLCAPIGLLLIWRHPTWSKQAKMKWAGASVGCFLLLGIIGKLNSKPETEWLEYNGNMISTEGLTEEDIADLKANGAQSTKPAGSSATVSSIPDTDTSINEIARGVAFKIKSENLWANMTPNRFQMGLEQAARDAGRADLLPIRAKTTQHHDDLTNVTTIYMEYNESFGVGFAINHSNPSRSTMSCSKIWLNGAEIRP
ncbi:DUF4339 domain-containing protein [Stieleria sp. JC731]|uniref:DUF4339 domain-containing protein n=1 Tax=Pirellulaceae TaxID=2691357 RepID=UPI001E445FE4|nr:DUF4339 domain-containing protein [Stieleria sp. JC731]MCC9602858.1 DUF4339 domain-containing protein [Stieleria sp. JC731]